MNSQIKNRHSTTECSSPLAQTNTQGISTGTTIIFAIACGLSVANVYFAHPLLDTMAADFGISASVIGLIVTLTQIGYACGLLFIVPLGDILDRRKLIVAQGLLSAIALTVVATTHNESVLFVAMVAVGLLAVVVQVLVAFAAMLASPTTRGKTVGMVTSGIVIGLLLARFISGVLADLGGWRTVYMTSAVTTLLMAILLYRILPRETTTLTSASYPALLRSVLTLFVEEPVLRVRAILALLIFTIFSIFWTALVLPLSAPPYLMSHTQIGLFGLAGLAGVFAAGWAGHLADRGLGQWTSGISLMLLLLSWVFIAQLNSSIVALIIGVIILDLAVQAVHVTNQSMIFAIRPEAHSRLVAGYMLFYSIGSAIGAIASTAVYDSAGWNGVCILGTAISIVAVIFWAVTAHIGRAQLQATLTASQLKIRI
ncbi:MFS transporter [Shewanella baltica]|uniref:MFS transporter n=1 Tax=Shewanella baltica TaxID=62322 RepID=UPI0028715642|nr:MFS transporter [Shewanella baltica]MDR9768294.1 MFS transporter [Shewanella baltica]